MTGRTTRSRGWAGAPRAYWAAALLGVCSAVPPGRLSAQETFDRSLSALLDVSTATNVFRDHYEERRYYVLAEAGLLWRYHPAAGIGLVARKGFGTQRGEVICNARSCGEGDIENLPWALEGRFSRRLTGTWDLELGAGTVLATRRGFVSHVGVARKGVGSVALHGDFQRGEWSWLVGAGVRGRPGLVALGAYLAYRIFSGFGASLD